MKHFLSVVALGCCLAACTVGNSDLTRLENGDEVIEIDGIPVANREQLKAPSAQQATIMLTIKAKDGSVYKKEIPNPSASVKINPK